MVTTALVKQNNQQKLDSEKTHALQVQIITQPSSFVLLENERHQLPVHTPIESGCINING
jgi:hypothetical protein